MNSSSHHEQPPGIVAVVDESMLAKTNFKVATCGEMDPELDFAAQAGFDLKPEVLEVLVHMLRAEYSPDAIVAVLQDIKNRKMKQMLSSMN